MGIQEVKFRLPLPKLLTKIGDEAHAKASARCPFHDDAMNSFSVFQTPDGAWLWKCFAGCGTGDGVAYLEKRFGLSTRDAIARYCQEAGSNGAPHTPPVIDKAFDWQMCVDAFTEDAARQLAEWRGFSSEFVSWLNREKVVGLYAGAFAFAVRNAANEVVSCHYLKDHAKKMWRYTPKGKGTHPLVFGDERQASRVLCFESQWDAFAVMDRLGWHLADGLPGTSIIITRGSENGKLVGGRCPPEAVVYAFVQNDVPNADGTIPAEKWLADVVACAGCKVLRVATPGPHKDANDWTQAGATKAEIESAIRTAQPIEIRRRAPAESHETPMDFTGITAWIRGEIVSFLLAADIPPATKRSMIAKRVVEALAKLGRFYFHADLRDFDSTMFFDTQHKRLERIRSDPFGAWLSEWLSVNRADTLFRFILAGVETAALSSTHTTAIVPESFWAARPGALYLSNGDGSAVKLTANGFELMDNGTDGVLFAAGQTLAPWKLCEPQDPFETCSIFKSVQCAATHGPDLLRAWIFSLPTVPASKPPLCLTGEVGSGKTRLARGIAELFGLPIVVNQVEETREDDFWVNLDAGGLYTLDNADTKIRWLANAVSNATTAGCSKRRKLYTNRDTVLLRANAWLCVTTANPTFASDAGLADRLLVERMTRRTEETSDAKLTEEILVARDAALTHIAATLQKALADPTPVPAGLNQRHPDFATFAVKIGRALGRETEVIAALQTAEADKSAFCLENDAIGIALLGYVREAGSFTGTAAELAPRLSEFDPELKDRLSAKRLGRKLSMLWPHLEKGFAVAKKETNRKGFTVFTFKTADCAEFQTPFS